MHICIMKLFQLRYAKVLSVPVFVQAGRAEGTQIFLWILAATSYNSVYASIECYPKSML